MRLRQIALVAPALEPFKSQLEKILGLGSAYQDPGVGVFGLENLVWPISGNFLEVVAPVHDNTAAGRYLDRKGGPGGYMVILQCGDAIAAREHITAKGIRAVWDVARDNYTATHYHPRDVGGTILSVDHTDAGEAYGDEFISWEPAGPNWRENVKTDVTTALIGAEIQSDNPHNLARLWSQLLVLPVHQDIRGNPQLPLENGVLRFTECSPGQLPGLCGIDLMVTNRATFMESAEAMDLLVREDHIIVGGIKIYPH